jgi:hypothetical protein
MERAFFKFGVWTAVAFVLLLALAGAIWGVHLVVEWFGLSLDTWSDRIFLWFLLAIGFGLFSFLGRTPAAGPVVRFDIQRPANIAAKDDITARWRLVNLPYALQDDMVLVLNDEDLPGKEIFASVVAVDRFVCPENDEWMVATLELDDPNDFERLAKSSHWYDIRDNAAKSPAEPQTAVPAGQAPKTIQ